MKWDDKYAPPHWNYKVLGRPDIVEMKLDKQVMKSKDDENKKLHNGTPAFKALSLSYMREFFGNKFVNNVLKGVDQ
ncbi:hypothetical protein KA005_16015 [bacterium]|nr:hypothetical protein [bacterium]